jgi:hypothetical protein
MSLAVRVSGTFIIEELEVPTGGAGSGVLHALPPPPQGSMLAGSALAIDAVAVDTLDLGAEADTGAGAGALILKAADNSCCGEVVAGGGGDFLVVVAEAGEENPKRSLDSDEDGGGWFGLDSGGDAKLVYPAESNPLDEIDVVRD